MSGLTPDELVQTHVAGYHGCQATCRCLRRRSRSFAHRELARRPRKSSGCFWWTSGLYHQQFTVLSLMTKSVIRSWRWRDTSRLSVCNWSSWSCLQEGPALQVHELVLSVRRALAGVQGLVASEGRVELDEMALELGRRHVAVVRQNPSRRELWRRAVVVAPAHGPHGPLLLQAIGHQLHDVVKLPLAKLVEVGGRRRMGQQLWKKTHKFAPLSGRRGHTRARVPVWRKSQ